MTDNIENVEPHGPSNNNGAYVRKISAQAETDEKPIGRVKDMQRFLMDFEAKNKAEAKRHDFPQKVKSSKNSALRPWEKKEEHQEEEQKERAVEQEDPEEEAKLVAEDIVEAKQEDIAETKQEDIVEEQQEPVSEPKDEEPAVEEVEDDAKKDDGDDDDDDDSLDDFEQVARAPSTPETSSQYTRIISKQAEADERPLESVSELKQWLIQTAPGTDKKNKTLSAMAAAERERAERKLINELSKRMTRDEAVKTARSYLRRISDQAVCEELPLMHVSEAQQFLMDFERKNKEHFEKHSVRHPKKRLGRCSGAAELHECEDKIDEEDDVKQEEGAQPDEQKGRQQDSVVEEIEPEEEVEASETSFDEEEGAIDLDESESLDISIDDGTIDEEETIEMEQPSIDGDETSNLTDSKLVQEKEDNLLDDAVKDFTAGIDNDTTLNVEPINQTQHQRQLQQPSFVITYDKSSRSLISDATSSAADDESKAAGADASDVFRKRYLTDVNEEDDKEESDRPKKLRRGLDLLKCLACPNPVKVVLNGGGGPSNGGDSNFNKIKKMMPKNPTVTMTSSADHEDIAASRRNLLGAGAIAPGGYEALESPSNSEMTLESAAAMTANGIYGIKQHPAQFRVADNSPANTNFSGSSDGLPKDNALTKYDIKSSDRSVGPDHLRWLEHQYQVTKEGDCHEC